MATHLQNLSDYDIQSVPSAEKFTFGIIVAEWNKEITFALAEGAVNTLKRHQAKEEHILVKYVPGAFELTLGAQFIAEYADVDAVICLGCVIQGETRHFDYICQSVSHGITELNMQYNLPFVFGVLTTDTYQQAQERAGGKHGNKGDEAAVAAIKMVAFHKDMEKLETNNHFKK